MTRIFLSSIKIFWKQELASPEVKDQENIKVLSRLKNVLTFAFIHVRRVRYKSKLKMEYYLNAIQNLKSRVGECNFFLFADDSDWAIQKFKEHIDFTPVQHNK